MADFAFSFPVRDPIDLTLTLTVDGDPFDLAAFLAAGGTATFRAELDTGSSVRKVFQTTRIDASSNVATIHVLTGEVTKQGTYSATLTAGDETWEGTVTAGAPGSDLVVTAAGVSTSPSLPDATAGARGAIRLAGDFSGTATSPTVVATHLAAPLPEAQGGTGALSLSSATVLSPGGGTARTLAERAGDLFWAGDYSSLAAAVAAAKAAGGGTVTLPPKAGGWPLASTLALPAGVALVGAQRTLLDSTFTPKTYTYDIAYSGAGPAVLISNADASSWQHMTRIENVAIRYTGTDPAAVGVRQSMSSALLRNVRVFDFLSHGFDFQTAIFSYYENLWALNCGGTGIRLASADETYPGGQAVLVNPQAQRCGKGLEIENYQTVQVVGGTLGLNTNQQVQILGGDRIRVTGLFVEPKLANDRTYVTNLMEVGSVTINSVRIDSKNVEITHSYLDAGQSGGTSAQFDVGLRIWDTNRIKVAHCTFSEFQVAGVKIDAGAAITENYDVGPNVYTSCAVNFDRVGSSAVGIQRDDNLEVRTYNSVRFDGRAYLALARQSPTYGANVTVTASYGNEFVVTPTNGSAFQIDNPQVPTTGQRITVRVRNTTGGALGTITWGTAYKMAAWTSPATGYSRSIDFQFDGNDWIEVSRTPADVPN